MELARGGNAELGRGGQAMVTVELGSAPGELDVSCYLVGSNGKVASDSYMVFYNQPSEPEGAIRFSQQGSKTSFAVNLDKLSPNVAKCVFAGTLSSGVFQQVRDLRLTASSGGEPITYRLTD